MKRFLIGLLAALALVTSAAAQAPRDPENMLFLDVEGGRVTIILRPDLAPKHVARIKELTRQKFYDGLLINRAAKDFVIQTGSPDNTTSGGPGYSVVGEVPTTTPAYPVGAVAFAKAGGFDEGIPLSVRLVFGMLRPKAHFKSIYVRPNAPKWHTSKPDADNLAKAVLDALVDCKVIDDDKRVALLYASKSYSTAAGCQITIGELE